MLMFGGKGLMQAPKQNTSNGPMLVCWFQQRWSNVGMLISTTLTRDYGERGGGREKVDFCYMSGR